LNNLRIHLQRPDAVSGTFTTTSFSYI